MKRIFAGILALALVLTFSTLTLAQDKMGKEMTKDDKSAKTEMKMGPAKSFSCDETCGFMIKSHDEGELVDAAMKHVKKHHPEHKATKKDIIGMIKSDDAKK